MEILNNWTDIDSAQSELANNLGIIDDDESFRKYKWIFWSNNKYGNALFEILMKLVEIEFFEYNKEEMKIRLNPNFDLNK